MHSTPKTLLALSLLFAPALFAQNADVAITNLTVSQTLTRTGERFALAMRWRNNGPARARNMYVTVTGTPAPFFILSVATSGWPCYPTLDGTVFTCQNEGLDPGAEAELVLQMLTPSTAGTFTVRGDVRSAEPDPNITNNVAQLSYELEAAPSADVSLTPATQTHVATAGQPVSMTVNVANSGATSVSNPIVYFAVPVAENPHPFSAQGEGWACGHLAFGPQAIICTRQRLEGGVTSPITVTTNAPATDGTLTIYARVRAEGHSDPFTANENATLNVQVGTTAPPPPPPPPAQVWTRILVPLTGRDAPGAGGSLWRTETTALLSSDMPFEVLLPANPFGVPVRTPFNLLNAGWVGQSPFGQILWVRQEDAAKLHINSRVYDVSRFEETAGSEIPIARDGDFTSQPASILGIPVAPQYRHTLRVYDVTGRNSVPVQIRVYADGESSPRASVQRTLVPQDSGPQDTFNMFPAYMQVDLNQLTSLTGVQTLRVDIEPLQENSALWSFVSVTNNDTHHVTTFSQN